MKNYDHSKIEKKWQKEWAKEKVFEAIENSDKPKFYGLIEFPYPSGAGLHVGHVRSNTAMDIITRKRRMEGFNVLYPIGWDAFGLPTENYAIKTGKQPALITKENTDNFRRQLQSIGFSFDWSREINTTDPKYYKWTQWIFLQMFKQGLAYKKKMTINWCPKDKIGLANEEVIAGCCERCGTAVEKREKEQWMLAITKYADRLDTDLDTVDYLPQIKTQQRNWIGKSEGAEIEFQVDKEKIKVFTTRPDTLFGVTFLAVSPELAQSWIDIGWQASETIKQYIKKTLADRLADGFDMKEKTGISAGFDAINPVNGEKVPVWIVNYVLGDVGTGAIMGVPAHDERDFEFAKKYNLEIKPAVIPRRIDHNNPHVSGKEVIFRKGIMAIIVNPKDNKILCLKWKKQPWTTFVMGGIEGDETSVEAAIREIREETGYKNIKLVRVLGGVIQTEFFAAHKDINRIAHTQPILFELENEERSDVSSDELAAYEVFWRDMKDITPETMTHAEMDIVLSRIACEEKSFNENGVLINSGQFDGLQSEEAKKAITDFVGGKMVTTYKLRDWVFSRQRYWGEPIPLIHCEACGYVPVPEKDLPVELPQVEKYEPTDNGESPLSAISSWVNVTCPTCGGQAKRETDTMPQWAGSSWYYLRYTDSKNDTEFADKKNLQHWTPVDWYNGGMEHTTLHVLYSRFWHKFLFDQGLVPTSEPYAKRTSHGLILAEGGVKMSKSVGNVVNPDEIITLYGADSLRLYEMFMGPFDQAIPWSTENIIGVRRFLEKVWRLQSKVESQKSIKSETNSRFELLLHQMIQKVSSDIEGMKFNTAVSAMMILLNECEKQENLNQNNFEIFLKLLSPFAPHITEEIWNELGHKNMLVLEPWPVTDVTKLVATIASVVVQVNGKVRGQVKVPVDTAESVVMSKVQAEETLQKWIRDKKITKVFYVPNRLINLVLEGD